MRIEGLDYLRWDDMFSRKFKLNDTYAWCGDRFMVMVARSFTRDEDEAFKWILQQDTVELIGVLHVSDGREVLLFERLYTSQSQNEATVEVMDYIRDRFQEHRIRLDLDDVVAGMSRHAV